MNETQSWLSPGVISGIVTVAMLLLFALLKSGLIKVFDLKPRTCDTQRPIKQLSKEYAKWELLGGLMYLALSASICWLLVRVAVWIGDSIAVNSPASVFNFEVASAIYALPGFFLALLLALPPSCWLLRMVLGHKRYDEYWYYYDHNYGVNSKKAMLIFSWVVVPLVIVSFLMIFNTVQRITPDNIQYSGFTELDTTTYRYDQVTKVEWVKSFKAPNGNIVRDPYYVIYFVDQQDWSLRDTLADLTQAQQQEIAQYIAQKSNLEITITDPYPR